MNLDSIRQRLDQERRTLVRAAESIEMLPSLTRIHSLDTDWHGIAYSLLDDATADKTIAAEVSAHRRRSGPLEWKVYSHDVPANLQARLQTHGFEVGPREVVLVLDLEDVPDWIEGPARHPVMRVSDDRRLQIFRDILGSVFGPDTGFIADELGRALQSQSTEHLGYIAYLEGVPASIGRLYTHPQSAFGGLYGGGTLASYRGRGLYRALIAARARDAAALGARFLIVDALPTSQPILESLGFVQLAETWPCTLPAAP